MSTGPQTTPGLDTPSQELAPRKAPSVPRPGACSPPLQPWGRAPVRLSALRRRRSLNRPQGPSLFALETGGGVSSRLAHLSPSGHQVAQGGGGRAGTARPRA